jgi:hypothetical protein
MKKFAVLTQYNPRHGDFYEKIFDTQQEAIEYADREWNHHLTSSEKKHIDFFGVVDGEVDEDGCYDYGIGGNIIKEYTEDAD